MSHMQFVFVCYALVCFPCSMCLHLKSAKQDSYDSAKRTAARQIKDLMRIEPLSKFDTYRIDQRLDQQ
jgi:hypothetical protein